MGCLRRKRRGLSQEPRRSSPPRDPESRREHHTPRIRAMRRVARSPHATGSGSPRRRLRPDAEPGCYGGPGEPAAPRARDGAVGGRSPAVLYRRSLDPTAVPIVPPFLPPVSPCLLYTSDAADDLTRVDL